MCSGVNLTNVGCVFGRSNACSCVLGGHAMDNACIFSSRTGAVAVGGGLNVRAMTCIAIAKGDVDLIFGTSGLVSVLGIVAKTTSGMGSATTALGDMTRTCSKLVLKFRLGG